MRFRRLSAPGASALSIWELRAPTAELSRAFGALPPVDRPRLIEVGRPAFDRGLLWLREGEAPGPVRAELHLHGGHGVATALRAWLQDLGFDEDAATAPCADIEEGFLSAGTRRAAQAWGRLRDGAFEHRVEELEALPAQHRVAAAESLLAAADWAEALESPPRLVLAGPPNAGKSTLLNRWLRRPRATVSPYAGTTRDAVHALVPIGIGEASWQVQLVDTAGLWSGGDDQVDREAVARSRAELAAAWRVLWIFDAASCPVGEPLDEFRTRATARDLRLLHRTDLGETWSPEERLGGTWLRGSVLQQGDALIAALEKALHAALGPAPAADALLPLGAARRERLRALAGRR